MTPLADKLKDVEAELTGARDTLALARKNRDQARDEFAKARDTSPASPVFRRADRAMNELREAQDAVNELQQVQLATLKLMGQQPRAGGDRNGPRSGEHFGSGWERIARELDLPAGHQRVDLPLGDLVRPPAQAGVTVTPSSGWTQPSIVAPFMPLARDERHVFMSFPTTQVEPEDMAVTDYRQLGERSLEGNVERDPLATSPKKAKLSVQVKLATPTLKTFAVVVEEVPNKLFEAIEVFGQFLTDELAYQVQLALDAHSLNQIAEAKPPVGEEGAALWIKVRNAVKQMRHLGAKPTVLALSPDDAAALDTLTAGADNLPVFALRDVGSSSPLFGLTIVEVPNLTAPVLIDPVIAGILYMGMARALADPFSALDKNQVRLRLECEALLHIRDTAGLYVIEKGS